MINKIRNLLVIKEVFQKDEVDFIVTTRKDSVKLEGRSSWPLIFMDVELKIESGFYSDFLNRYTTQKAT